MKRIIILTILSLAVAMAAAQEPKSIAPSALNEDENSVLPEEYVNHYVGDTGTITQSGYTYKYRNGIISGVEVKTRIELYNADNKFLDVPWNYKDGTPKNEGESLGYYQNSYYFSYSSLTYNQLRTLVAGQFTSQQKNSIQGNSMVVQALVDPDTGKVVDVYFSFRRAYRLVYIPVETFRNIELAIKEKLTITATDQGRKFNFIEFIWEQKF
jgi:hypothetical protein